VFQSLFVECARIENNPHVAFRTLESLRMLPSLSNDVLAKIQLEEAQLCWSIQDVVTAKRILRQLSANENVNPRLVALFASFCQTSTRVESSERLLQADCFLKGFCFLGFTRWH
jgi:hypothetical protein